MNGLAWALAALIGWGVFTFGGVYPWAWWPLICTAALVGLWQLIVEQAWQDARVRQIAIAVGLVTFAIFLQTVPLPSWLTATVSPGVDRFIRTYEVFYKPLRLRALSIDPASTAVALAIWTGFALAFVGLIRGMRRVPLEQLLMLVMAIGATVAVVGIAQLALRPWIGPRVLFAWPAPPGADPFGPFVNKEHFVGWMAMVLPLSAGYTLALLRESARAPEPGSRPGRWRLGEIGTGRRLRATAAVALMAASVAATGSRAGLASIAIGLGVATADGWRRDRRGQTRLFAAGIAAIVLTSAAWAAIGTIDRGQGRLTGLADRWPAWKDAARIVADFPATGTGLGTFSRAMLVYQRDGREFMFAETHNDYLQLLAEGGVLVGAPAVALLVVLGLAIRRRLGAGEDDPIARGIRLGALGGLAGIAAFSLVQFSLQLPGVAICFVVLLALAVHRPRRRLAHAHRI